MRVALLGIVALALVACDLTGDPPSNAFIPDRDADATPTPLAAIETLSADGCGRDTTPGTRGLAFESSGNRRSARLYVPSGYDPEQRTPLVLGLQGGGLSAQQFSAYSGLTKASEELGFISLLPDVDPNIAAWRNRTGSQIDIRFVQEIVAALKDELCIDSRRIYAVGYSDGAAFAHTLACGGTELVGIAIVALQSVDACESPSSISVVGFHGTADPVEPYAVAVPDAWAAGWAGSDGCDPTPVVEDHAAEGYNVARYGNCTSGAVVALYTIQGGGHTWPGAAAMDSLGPTAPLDATAEIISFFGLDE